MNLKTSKATLLVLGLALGCTTTLRAAEGVHEKVHLHLALFPPLQLGLINVADRLTGIQIGLLNFALGKEHLRVLPIVNASF